MNYKICDIESVEELDQFDDEYVYDLEMDTHDHTFFANNILVHNSCYLSLSPLVNNGIPFKEGDKITPEFYTVVKELNNRLNSDINIWAASECKSLDTRFVFKREAIADIGIFLTKKRYILHLLDFEDIPCNKFKYVGVDVVRSTMPSQIKPHMKGIVETMLMTQDYGKTNEAIQKVYDIYKSLPIDALSTVSNLNNYEKGENNSDGFAIGKGTSHHVKASILYNRMIELLKIESKYEKISSGDKVRLLFVCKPNRFNIDKIAYKSYYPEEFKKYFEPDYDTIFDKVVFSSIERLYDNVKWEPKKPSDATRVNLIDLFG